MNDKLRTKIICTIGPTSQDPRVLRGLIKGGASALRINLSHTSTSEAVTIFKNIRKISKDFPIIVDTQGKETRIFSPTKQLLRRGEKVGVIVEGQKIRSLSGLKNLFITRSEVLSSFSPGDMVYVDDNSIQLKFLKSESGSQMFVFSVVKGGLISSPKNIRVKKVFKPKSLLTERDKQVIKDMKKYGVEEVSLSYVSDYKDVVEARTIIGSKAKLSSKVETLEAVKNLDGLIKFSDSILIDRNDLGTEVGYEKVPLIQKFITKRCLNAGKPIFVATHLLETMTTREKPTRGEVNDIINLVLDGVSGLVLSSETAIGKNPVKILLTLKKLIRQGEFILNKQKNDSVANVIERLEELKYI